MVTPTPFEKILLKKGGGSARFAERLMKAREKPRTGTTKKMPVKEYAKNYEPAKPGAAPTRRTVATSEPAVVEPEHVEEIIKTAEDRGEPTPEFLEKLKAGAIITPIDKQKVIAPSKPFVPSGVAPYTYGTGTMEQILGKPGTGFAPRTVTYATDIDAMALKKKHYLGRDVEGEPQYATVTESKYYHGYDPSVHDPKQVKIYEKVETGGKENLGIVTSNIETAEQAIAQKTEIISFIKSLESAPPNTPVTYTEILPADTDPSIILKYQEEGYDVSPTIEGHYEVLHEETAKDAIPFFKKQLGELEEIEKKYPTYVESKKDIIRQQNIIEGYKELGYYIEETDTGYSFKEPESSKVYLWKHGTEISGTALSSAAFLASPLAIQTVGSGIQYIVTGEEATRKEELERLSEYALGLDVSIKKGKYLEEVVKSPAMVEGVYLPAITLGISKGVSLGISAVSPHIATIAGGVGGRFTATWQTLVGHVPATVRTAAVIAKEPFVWAGKGALKLAGTPIGKQAVKYSLYFGLEGKPLIETAARIPEAFGGELARSLFGWELRWGAMELGFKGTRFPEFKKAVPAKEYPRKLGEFFETSRMRQMVKDYPYHAFGEGRIPISAKVYPKAYAFKTRVGRALTEPGWELVGTVKGRPDIWKPPTKVRVGYEDVFLSTEYEEYLLGKTLPVETRWGETGKVIWLEHRPPVKGYYMEVPLRPEGDLFFGGDELQTTAFTKEDMFWKMQKKSIVETEMGLPEFEKTTKLLPKGKYYFEATDDVVIGVTDTRYGMKDLFKKTDTSKMMSSKLKIEGKTIGRQVQYLGYEKPAKVVTKKPFTYYESYQYEPSLTTVKRPLTREEYEILQIAEAQPYYTQKTQFDLKVGIFKKPDIKKITGLDVGQLGEVASKEIYREIQVGITALKPVVVTKKKEEVLPITATTAISEEIEKMGEVQEQDLGLGQIQGTVQELALEQELASVTKLDLLTMKKYDMDLRTIEPITPDEITTTTIDIKPPWIGLPDEEKAGKKLLLEKEPVGKGFNVYVKERSMYGRKIVKPTKFKKVNVHSLTKRDALSLGATIADESAAISFKIKPTDKKPKKSLLPTKSFESIGHKFRKKGDVYIEKTKYRIDTPGEIKEISARGWLSNKRKAMTKKDLVGGKVDRLIGTKNSTKRKKNVRYI